jgi:hypothetical protein
MPRGGIEVRCGFEELVLSPLRAEMPRKYSGLLEIKACSKNVFFGIRNDLPFFLTARNPYPRHGFIPSERTDTNEEETLCLQN